MIAPQSILQTCNIISSIRFANVRRNQQTFKYSPLKYKNFHKFEHFKYAPTPYILNLATKKTFVTKLHLKEASGLITINWYVNNMERPFFPTEIEACKELARLGLISKHHYHPQVTQFDVLDRAAHESHHRITISVSQY